MLQTRQVLDRTDCTSEEEELKKPPTYAVEDEVISIVSWCFVQRTVCRLSCTMSICAVIAAEGCLITRAYYFH